METSRRAPTEDRRRTLDAICDEHGLLAVYLFGSRADEGLAVLRGERADASGSDLDVGVVYRDREEPDFRRLGALQVDMEDLFEPLRVDLVPLQKVDALFQFRAMDQGHRVAAPDSTKADFYELYVMRQASELLPIQRRLEEEEFGVSTS
jgi:predicted nucleotidyltransferase